MKLIQYIGKSVEKRDSVRPGSGRVWKGHGTIQEVGDSEAFLYAGAHPDAFREITEEDNQQFVESMKGSTACANTVAAMMDRVATLPDLELVRTALAQAEKRIRATPPAVVLVPTVDYSAQAADAELIKRLVIAIGLIDREDERLAVNGWPTADAIEYVSDIRPTDEQIALAMELGFPDIKRDAEPKKAVNFDTQERAQMARAEVESADIGELREMATTFSIEFSMKQNTETLRNVVREGLEKLA